MPMVSTGARWHSGYPREACIAHPQQALVLDVNLTSSNPTPGRFLATPGPDTFILPLPITFGDARPTYPGYLIRNRPRHSHRSSAFGQQQVQSSTHAVPFRSQAAAASLAHWPAAARPRPPKKWPRAKWQVTIRRSRSAMWPWAPLLVWVGGLRRNWNLMGMPKVRWRSESERMIITYYFTRLS